MTWILTVYAGIFFVNRTVRNSRIFIITNCRSDTVLCKECPYKFRIKFVFCVNFVVKYSVCRFVLSLSFRIKFVLFLSFIFSIRLSRRGHITSKPWVALYTFPWLSCCYTELKVLNHPPFLAPNLYAPSWLGCVVLYYNYMMCCYN